MPIVSNRKIVKAISTQAGGGVKTWYVRPSGGSYGDEDGTSYDTAWDGFANIDWTASGVQPNDTLYICGTHNELLTIGGSGESGKPITIRGDYEGDAGVVDSQDTRNIGIQISSINYVTLTSLSTIDAVVSCLNIQGTSTGIVTNSIIATGSGNQGIQHLNSVSATHNNPTSTGNVDDGISGHDSANIIINGGTITNNSDGINIIEDVRCTVNGPITFLGNATQDIYMTQSTTEESVVATINDVDIPVSINISLGAKAVLNNCNIEGYLDIAVASINGFDSGSGFVEMNDCNLTGNERYGSGADVTSVNTVHNATITQRAGGVYSFNGSELKQGFIAHTTNAINSIFDSISFTAAGICSFYSCLIKTLSTDYVGNITIEDSYVLSNAALAGCDMIATRCLFSGGTDQILDVESGSSISISYSVFKNIAASKFGIALRTGSTASIDNCTFIGNANVGRGIFSQIDVTINNNIFLDLDVGIFRNAGTFVSNNSCLFDNTTDITGTVTNTDPVTTDPLLTYVANNDFSLGVGSSCIGAGKTLTEATGIDTADWGNGTDETPTVTTKEQTVPWDIGAYVN
jgi:hypothetical protein